MEHQQENAYRNALKMAESATEGEGNINSGNEGDIGENQNAVKVGAEPGTLGKVQTEFEKKQIQHEESKAIFNNKGWRKIDTNNLPSQGKFNDPSMRVKIRAATVEEIKHYSSLDDTDLLDVTDHINELLNSCCRIEYPGLDRIGVAAGDLKEADKYYVLFCIRDLTMDSHQKYHKLQLRTTCPKCGKHSESEITSQAFSSYTIPKNIIKYYDPTQRKIVINDPSFEEPLMVSPPSLAVTSAITKYMQNHVNKQQAAGQAAFFDQKFMVELQYIIDSPSQVTDEYLKNLQKKIGLWSPEKIIAFEYLKNNMDVGVRPQLEIICRNTKSIDSSDEVGCTDDFSFTAPVAFRFGWRSVFDISGVVARLFDSDSE